MSSSPQEQSTAAGTAGEGAREAADGDRVVISGMAGLYPQARYVKDLENILYNKLNPVSADNLRWKYNHPEAAQFTGSVPDLDRFDAQFFKVHYRLGMAMDCMSRKLLEQAYEAIYDAGQNPVSLSGKKIGVYIGSCFSESEKFTCYNFASRLGLGIAGCNKSMFANRISYWLNVKGPSMSIDQACCSSTAALGAACQAIARGECEAALVGGANVCLHPQSSVHYGRIMKISKDGKTRSFAEDAAGCVKSEAVNCLFLQKAKDSKRVYANVIHVKTEFLHLKTDGTGPMYGFYRDPAIAAKFLKTFYKEVGVAPAEVEYVEAFGSAVPEADKSELEAIDTVFCSEREKPLLVGSVMSNIGYGEAASGISAVTKVLLGYHKGALAGNLHCSEARRDVAALREGRMRVLQDTQSFRRTYAAVNSMSVTGVNAHVLLHGHYKHKDLDRYKSSIPRLVTISGRQESAVERVLDLLKSHPIDPEEIAMLHNIHEANIPGHLGKGYTILDSNPDGKPFSIVQHVENCDGARRPLWFVYSGMGSQWASMGAQLMSIPIFAAAIQRCHKVLEPKGIDIVDVITSKNGNIFNNILHSFVGIAAVQIGLTDILLQLGLVPDNIIGHSVGELACAYADGCLTAEEVILSAYSRGRVSLDTTLRRGSMAAVGVSARQMSSMCPPKIEIACHNSAESCTISGPAEAMRSFVADLTARGIFAKEVPCSNIAYHSRYIADAGPGLLKYLKEVIKTPRARSERWVSSSVPQDRWDEPAAKYSSAEYHTNNLLSPVLFEEASALIPADAVLVEVAPHGLLQAILKRALPDSASNIPLTRRGHKDNVLMLLDAIGKLYLHGFYPKVHVLYPTVEFPVSTGTPFLSTYVEWAHQEEWDLPLYQAAHRKPTASCTFVISTHDYNSYLQGHVIGNKTLLPFSYALVATWDTLAMSLNVPKKSINVEFRDVKLYTQPILHDQKTVRLSVALHRGNGWFEVMDNDSRVITGFITVPDPSKMESIYDPENTSILENHELSTQDLYRVLYERGYSYSGVFRSIHSTNSSVSEANIAWNDNWVPFIDGLLQLNTLKYTHCGVSQPDLIVRIVINPTKLNDSVKTDNDKENKLPFLFNVVLSDVQKRTSCSGVIIEKIRFCNVLQANADRIVLQTLKFVPRFDSKYDVSTSLYVLLQIATENVNKDIINVVGLRYIDDGSQLFEEMEMIAEKGILGKKVQYQHMSIDTVMCENKLTYEDVDIILVQKLSRYENIAENLHRLLKRNTFILNEEDVTAGARETHNIPSKLYNVVSVLKNAQTQLELARWRSNSLEPITSTFTVYAESDLPLLKQARNSCSSVNGFLVMTSYPPVAGLLSLVKQWRRDSTCNHIHIIMTNENLMKTDCSEDAPGASLAYNVFENGLWGGEYYLPVEKTCAVRDNIVLRVEEIGDLNSLKWAQGPKLTGSGNSVAVHYTAINVGDVKQALGLLLQDNNKCAGFGLDFSGITERGERVMGLVPSGAANSFVMAQPELTWPVPAHWTLEDAATVPFAYVFAYYCLIMKAHTRVLTDDVKQFTVLVHGGAGALGQAAISVALARGWRVFTTVSDCGKKRFLTKLFPQLREKDIGNSRDASFGDMVLNGTNGKGCNVVLITCLKQELKDVSLKCCAPSSLVLDTTQILSKDNYFYGMYNMREDRSYVAVDIASILNDPNSEDVKKLHTLVSEGIERGVVRPLTRVTFAPDEAARAFRLLAASRHRGRALLCIDDELAPPRHRVTSEAALPIHMIICGISPLGVQVADTLIERGITNLHLHVNAPTGYLQYKLRVWEKKNIKVAVTYEDIEKKNSVSDLMRDAVNSGFLEGVHIISDSTLQENFIKRIDLATRTVCPSLKHFVVVSINGSSGHYTCAQRAKSGLPATLLDLSLLKKVQDVDGGTWYRSAAVAVVHALQSTAPVLLAIPERSPKRTLVQQIAALAELNISSDTKSSVSLEDLGMTIEKSAPICVYLKDVYNTSFDEKLVPLLTLERLNQIEAAATETQLKELPGLERFYSVVDSDELLATKEIVFLPTLTNRFTMRDDEYDVNDTFLCIVPGLEGHHARFRALCEHLKLPAFVLQPGLDHPDETPAELAHRLSKVLLQKTSLMCNNTFYILGYETGVVVALELAAILEEHELTGTVFCLGDGPAETAALLEHSLSPYPDAAALQEAVARHMFALMTHGSDAGVERALRGCSSWGARVDACVRALLGRVPHSAQYARALLEAAFARIAVARRVGVAPRALRSRLVLLRARSERDGGERETCSLQCYSQQALHVRELSVPMVHAAADPRVPAIINSYLDDNILQAFEKKNLCDTNVL